MFYTAFITYIYLFTLPGHVYGKNKFIGPFIDGQHITKVSGMWKEQGKDCPWALALGAPPAAVIAGSMPLPDGVSEPEYVGAMTGIPVEVVKCETNNLYVPANSGKCFYFIALHFILLFWIFINLKMQKLFLKEGFLLSRLVKKGQWVRCTVTFGLEIPTSFQSSL